MNEIEEKLKKLELKRSEIKVYLYLLESGAGTPPLIAKGTGIARTNCYHILQSLQSKNLVTERSFGKRIQYVPKDPQALLSSLESKKTLVESLLPDLRALYGSNVNKPSVRFYEGFNEVKAIYQKSFESELIKAFGSTKELSVLEPEFFTKYFKELKKRGIILRDILTYESKENLAQAKEILGYLYEPVLLTKKHENLMTDMLLWGDHVALITLKEPVTGVILTNVELAKTFNAIHDALFEQLL